METIQAGKHQSSYLDLAVWYYSWMEASISPTVCLKRDFNHVTNKSPSSLNHTPCWFFLLLISAKSGSMSSLADSQRIPMSGSHLKDSSISSSSINPFSPSSSCSSITPVIPLLPGSYTDIQTQTYKHRHTDTHTHDYINQYLFFWYGEEGG